MAEPDREQEKVETPIEENIGIGTPREREDQASSNVWRTAFIAFMVCGVAVGLIFGMVPTGLAR